MQAPSEQQVARPNVQSLNQQLTRQNRPWTLIICSLSSKEMWSKVENRIWTLNLSVPLKGGVFALGRMSFSSLVFQSIAVLLSKFDSIYFEVAIIRYSGYQRRLIRGQYVYQK